MPENAIQGQQSPSANSASQSLPPGCRMLNDGSGRVVLPRFAVLDECKFWNEKKKRWEEMTPERLRRIADRINARFDRTGDMVPIIPGHTVPGLPEEKQPRVIGNGLKAAVEPFVNPRTGQQVTENGRGLSALYLTPIAESINEVPTFQRLKRGRSVEIWIDPVNGDDIDPIALLGANTPRRDLGPHQLAKFFGEPLNLFRFSRHGSDSAAEHFQLEVYDGGDDMPDEPKPDDGSGKIDDSKQTEFNTLFENSPLGKQLKAMLDQISAMVGQEGATQGAGGDEEDLFAPAAGHQGAPAQMAGGAAACSPASGTNAAIPGYEHKPKPSEHRGQHEPSHMQREGESIRLARLERELADSKREISDLKSVNLMGQVERELRAIENDFEFDFQEQLVRLSRLPAKADREAEIAYIVKHFRKKEAPLPGGGRRTVPDEDIAPTQFQRGLSGAAPERFSALTDDDLVRLAKTAYREGSPNSDDVEELLAKANDQKRGSANGQGTNGVVAVR